MATFSQQVNRLLKVAQNNKVEPYYALDRLLDYLIATFDVQNLQRFDFDYTAVFLDAKERDADMFLLLRDWFVQVTEEIESGKGFLDWFGAVYEEAFKSKSKASALGQFYTPEAICDMMARIVTPEGHMNDCACGSGRTMIAAWAHSDKTKFAWFEGADIDFISCKMCALNFMIHGMLGIVKQQDTLRLTTPGIIYHINEVRWPVPTAMYSIRIEIPEDKPAPPPPPKKEEAKPKENNQPIQLSLF